MAEFLYTASDTHGRRVNSRVESPNLAAARTTLEHAGWIDIVFHETELNHAVRQSLGLRSHSLQPDQAVTQTRAQGVLASLWNSLRGTPPLRLVIALSVGLMLGFALLLLPDAWEGRVRWLLVLAWLTLLLMPVIVIRSVIRAAGVARWDRVKRRIRLLKFHALVFPTRIGVATDFYWAKALAFEGRLPEALQHIEKYRGGSMPEVVFLIELGDVYSKSQDEEMSLECQRMAVERGTGSSLEIIGYAFALAYPSRRTQEARAWLESLANREITPMGAYWKRMCEGVILHDEGAYSEAERALDSAIQLGQPWEKSSPILATILRAHRGLCLVELGRVVDGLPLLTGSIPMLEAHREVDLLGRCRSVLAAHEPPAPE